jgi:hypothetical protein
MKLVFFRLPPFILDLKLRLGWFGLLAFFLVLVIFSGSAVMAAPSVISGIKARPFVDHRHHMELAPAYRLTARADSVRVGVEALPQFKLMGATGALIVV